MSITETHKQDLVAFLVKELGCNSNVKEFSDNLRELNLCDLKDDSHLETVTDNGGAVLQTLVTWQQLGFISKLIEIKRKFK